MIKTILLFLFLSVFNNLIAQKFTLPLWNKDIPNYKKTNQKEVHYSDNGMKVVKLVQKPAIEVFLPSQRSSTHRAVVICPGGGYRVLVPDWEGSDIAKWLNSKGIAAIVLKYRLPLSKSNIVPYKSPLLDAQRALRLVRFHAKDWDIDSSKVGIMGFSAGGHVASTLGTHFNVDWINNKDSIDYISARPDFMILMYPVITFRKPYAHMGSRINLIGDHPASSLIDFFSNELNVKKNTPPTFIVQATDDKSVPVENSLMFYSALKAKGIPVEMHIYPKGGHGFALAIGKGYLSTWVDRCIDWINNLKN